MPHLDSPPPARENLKVLIAATPKTGNFWLKILLTSIYSLRDVHIPAVPDEGMLMKLGVGWIAHQHFSPTDSLLRHLRRQGVIVLTMFRHPCDVLVSLKSFLANLNNPQENDQTASTLLDDGDVFGERALQYIRSSFPTQVNLSLFWAKTGAHPVRYEDLLTDPEGTLQSLTPVLGPAPIDRIREAVELSSMERLRKKHSNTAFHFRQGRSGNWRAALPDRIKETFRHLDPYPEQFKALGYTMDEPAERFCSEETNDTPTSDGAADAPSSEFLCKLFHELPEACTSEWNRPTPPLIDGPYLKWLNLPANEETINVESTVPITNLAKEIHGRRPDLQRAFPDIFGADRLGFANWFLLRSEAEYGLDLRFRTALLESIAKATSLNRR